MEIQMELVFIAMAAAGTVAGVAVTLWLGMRSERRYRRIEREGAAKEIAEWRRSLEATVKSNTEALNRHEDTCDTRAQADKEWKDKFEEKSSQRAKELYDHIDERMSRTDERIDKILHRK